MRKIVGLIIAFMGLVDICNAQPLLQSHDLRSELNQLFQAARQDAQHHSVRRYTQDALQQMLQTAPATLSLHHSEATLNHPAVLSSKTPIRPDFAKISVKNHTEKAQHPWQLLLFVATDGERISATLAQLRLQIKAGTLYQAVVLDTTAGSKNAAKLHFLYQAGNRARTQTKTLAIDISTEELLNVLLSNFQQDSQNHYTEVIVSAHGSGGWTCPTKTPL